MGYAKNYFVVTDEICSVLAGHKPCRHIEFARPSMSGFGVDVTRLMASSGWSAPKEEKSDLSGKDATSWVAGLIMLI